MPQMSPLNWLLLFIFFSLIFIYINILNYFLFKNEILKKNFKMMENNIYWKW